MAKHTYVLEQDYLTADAKLYKRGEQITLDENDSAVKLCAPLGAKSLPDAKEPETLVKEDKTKAKGTSGKSKKKEISNF